MVYGMTGGQVAPTTPVGTSTTTTPYGSFERPLDAASLAAVAGAAYSARWTTAHAKELKESIKTALGLRGFRFVEVVSQCPTAFGRRAGLKDVGAMLAYFRENSLPREQAERAPERVVDKSIVVGEFARRERPTLVDSIYGLMGGAKEHDRKN